MHHADADGGVGALGQPLGVDDRAAAQLVQVEVGVAELEQAGAELVLVGVAVLLDEAVRQQGLEQAVDGGAGELEPVGELADAEPPWPAASAFRMRAARSTDWIVPRLGALLRFDIVESTSIV